ncbi:CcdB family protein [Amorphus sp. 3PC139-8]|uniref:CcdB family protein n=1 Tax=Amorphus sp. 3PC139-8 TaxID=2735676 RepID=UPI00345D3B65
MARFSVHRLSDGVLVVNLQSDFLDWLDTRLVAPLIPLDKSPPPARYLNPIFSLDGDQFVLIIQSMAAVPTSALGATIADLSPQQDEITRALDMVFQGF